VQAERPHELPGRKKAHGLRGHAHVPNMLHPDGELTRDDHEELLPGAELRRELQGVEVCLTLIFGLAPEPLLSRVVLERRL